MRALRFLLTGHPGYGKVGKKGENPMAQIKKFTFGQPEALTPSAFCPGFTYREGTVSRSEGDFSFRAVPTGCVLEYRMEPGTRVLGFGLQLKQFDHTGHKVTLRVNADPVSPNGESHAPVPFFVTDKGYGLYVDTARYAEFYCGVRRPGDRGGEERALPGLSTEELYAARRGGEEWMSIRVPGAAGVEVYLIEGDSVGEIVAAYNRMAGGGPSVPEWGLGVLYRCCTRYDEKRVREMAAYFRRAEIPCDILGLEPGWQSHTYSCSYTWDPGRFPDPAGLVRDLRAQGFHVNLWEHAFVHPTAPIYEALLPYAGDYGVWGGLVPDLALPAAREIFAAHHRTLTALGIDGFKLDECDGSDNTGGWSFPLHTAFPSGLDGEQYHSLFGALYARTMTESLSGPTLSQIRQMGALAAPWPFVLYSDLYDHRDFVRGIAAAGLSGLLWTPEVRHAESKKDMIRRLQTAVFSVQCLINAWYCDEAPWLKWDCEEEVRELLKLRRRLVPMLKAAFDRYAAEGVPPTRPLVCDFSRDPEVWSIDDEYMFCDLLVAPIIGTDSDEREVYLPAGEWVNWFTGEPVSPGRFTVRTEGIPVYQRK